MFAICGYQFAPRHADISDTQLWWVDTAMLRGEITRDHRGSNGWGAFNELQLRRVSVPAIVQYWDDMVRVAGSLSTNKVRAYDLIKMMTAGGRLTGLGNAFAAYGRIFKTLHLLQIIHVESYRRMIGTQLNTGESRHQRGRGQEGAPQDREAVLDRRGVATVAGGHGPAGGVPSGAGRGGDAAGAGGRSQG
jgi:TnpA family transposase